ncbi:MAG: hypothetical protein JXA61_00270 [Bacteroidales bacterium]|nr:hypothetical protein [Bacteroidales bacterium]
MKFIVMTNSGWENTFVNELIKAKLIPSLIVTDGPFHCENRNPIKYIIKKCILLLKYILYWNQIKIKYQSYYLAKKHSIPIWPSHRVNSDVFAKRIHDMELDYIFVFTFRILQAKIFKASKFGCINFHPSLLPVNRGATPINWNILNNQSKAGITFHFITKEIDAGPIIEQYEIQLSGFETVKILKQYLYALGARLFVRLIYKLKNHCRYVLKNNNIALGSYEPAFNKEQCYISEKNTFKEMDQIIKAASTSESDAAYRYSGKECTILDCIDVTDCGISIKEIPFHDNENNIYLKSMDDRTVLLITKKMNGLGPVLQRVKNRLLKSINS